MVIIQVPNYLYTMFDSYYDLSNTYHIFNNFWTISRKISILWQHFEQDNFIEFKRFFKPITTQFSTIEAWIIGYKCSYEVALFYILNVFTIDLIELQVLFSAISDPVWNYINFIHLPTGIISNRLHWKEVMHLWDPSLFQPSSLSRVLIRNQ